MAERPQRRLEDLGGQRLIFGDLGLVLLRLGAGLDGPLCLTREGEGEATAPIVPDVHRGVQPLGEDVHGAEAEALRLREVHVSRPAYAIVPYFELHLLPDRADAQNDVPPPLSF